MLSATSRPAANAATASTHAKIGTPHDPNGGLIAAGAFSYQSTGTPRGARTPAPTMSSAIAGVLPNVIPNPATTRFTPRSFVVHFSSTAPDEYTFSRYGLMIDPMMPTAWYQYCAPADGPRGIRSRPIVWMPGHILT